MGFFTPHDMDIGESVQQQLNFNLHAWETINYDIYAFDNIPDKFQLGKFVNQIILNYAHDAKCSIAEHREEHVSRLKEYFEIKDFDNEDDFLKCMIRASVKPPGDEETYVTRRIHINEKVKDLLYHSENDIYYDYSRKDYMEAVINEYVSLPFAEREKIYFKEKCDKINDSILEHRWLNIEVHKEKYKVCPYFLETDKSTNYNYLVCSESDSSSDNKLISFRLQHIRIISVDKEPFKKCTKAKLKEYKKEIERLGVPYIRGAGDPKIKVKLTEQGLINYKCWINQRPKPDGEIPAANPDGTTTITFNCSMRQIKNYFFKFGKDALILEPAELKESFRKEYQEALEAYEK